LVFAIAGPEPMIVGCRRDSSPRGRTCDQTITRRQCCPLYGLQALTTRPEVAPASITTFARAPGGPSISVETSMTDDDHMRKLEELERILNDPDVSLDPARVWALLAEVSQRQPSMAEGGSGETDPLRPPP
jgi:hypothetical protein